MKRLDLVGQVFGMLVVNSFAGTLSEGSQWNCYCECGEVVIVRGSNLKNGHTQSCGCLHRKRTSSGKRLKLIGQTFGLLTVLEFEEVVNKHSKWKCLCACGKTLVVSGSALVNGHSKSCGCVWRKHGMSQTGVYKSWVGMQQRCFNPNDKDYKNYGAVGITVCDRWLKFENFLADMGEKPAGKSIDRFPDPYGNYEPKNCRWATAKEQRHNWRQKVES